MKTLLTLLAFAGIGSLLAAASAAPAGFADVPFGASVRDVRAAMSHRPGVKAAGGTADRLTFTGGGYSGLPATRWTLGFAGGKFAVGSVLLEDVKKPMYDYLKAQLASKYGQPGTETRIEGEGRECRWDFRGAVRTAVRLEYERAGKITVTFSRDTTP